MILKILSYNLKINKFIYMTLSQKKQSFHKFKNLIIMKNKNNYFILKLVPDSLNIKANFCSLFMYEYLCLQKMNQFIFNPVIVCEIC